ncbi:MAG: hypothetical protein ACRDN6_09405 [Gaiellaceae bacterium]
MRPQSGLVRSFLVEAYLRTCEAAELEALGRQASAVAAGSQAIRYLGSLVLLKDEVCFHVFEAPSLDAIVDASEREELASDRIVETIWIAPGGLEALTK